MLILTLIWKMSDAKLKRNANTRKREQEEPEELEQLRELQKSTLGVNDA